MLRGIVGLIFFTFFALGSATLLFKLKKPEHIFLSAALIAAPWAGGIWIAPVKFDFRLTHVFLVVALLLSMGKSQTFKNRLPVLVTFPLFALIIWTIISAMQAYDPAIALGDGPIAMFMNFLYLLTIVKVVKKDSDLDIVIKSAFVGLLFTSLLALIQYKVRMFQIGFIDTGYADFMWWRPRATFRHPNAYGMYQLIILPIVFRQAVIMIRAKNQKSARNYLLLFCLSAFTLFTTSNRGSWVGFAAGMVIVVGIDLIRIGFVKMRKIMIRIIITLVLISILPLAKYGPRIYDRMFSGKDAFDRKAESRLSYNTDAWVQFNLHPVMGVGVSNIRYYSSIIFTHNLYILMLSETGVVGFAFFVLYMLGLIGIALKAMKSKNAYVSAMGSGFLSTMIALLIASYPGPDFGITNQVSNQLWIVAGITFSLIGLEKRDMLLARLKKRQLSENQFDKTPPSSSSLIVPQGAF